MQNCAKSLNDLTQPLNSYDTEPWIRAVPYLFGVTLAFFYNAMGEFSNGSQVISRPLTRFITYVIMTACLTAPVFTTYTMRAHTGSETGTCKWDWMENSAYLSLFRLSWSIGIFLLAGTCMIGWNNPISKMLSARAWSPFSRLVYGVYLVCRHCFAPFLIRSLARAVEGVGVEHRVWVCLCSLIACVCVCVCLCIWPSAVCQCARIPAHDACITVCNL